MTNTPNTPPAICDFKPFLGYGEADYDNAKAFYEDIGFEKTWDDGKSACSFDTGIGHRFLVTLHIGMERGQANMMQLHVESVDDWAAHLAPLKLDEKYDDVKIADPTITEWGWKILYVWDPGGYLWHIAEPHSEENKVFFKETK